MGFNPCDFEFGIYWVLMLSLEGFPPLRNPHLGPRDFFPHHLCALSAAN